MHPYRCCFGSVAELGLVGFPTCGGVGAVPGVSYEGVYYGKSLGSLASLAEA